MFKGLPLAYCSLRMRFEKFPHSRFAFVTSSKEDETYSAVHARTSEAETYVNSTGMPPKFGRKVIQTRARGTTSRAGKESGTESAECSQTGSVSKAPTSLVVEKRSHEIEMLEMKVQWQNEKINELTKERDFLKEQLASVFKKDTTSENYSEDTRSLSSDTAECSSESSECLSPLSSDDDKKKKLKNKEGKGKKVTEDGQRLSKGPISKPGCVQLYRKGGTMARAFKRYGVDQNTIVITAPIAELSITAPRKYAEVFKNYNSQVKLCVCSTLCICNCRGSRGRTTG
uniref:Coiled-coil domain containing 106 n=1 Tax=Iconisemion striatum TaxID=60296 RepID=A0A1A7WUL2_9TELE